MSENEQQDTGDVSGIPDPDTAVESESEVIAAGTGDTADSADGTVRRNFLVEIAAAAIGLIVGVVPAVTGGLFFLHPLFKGQDEEATGASGRPDAPVKDEQGRLKTSVTLDSLPEDGSPLQLKMLDDIVDAWNLFPDQEIGSIWIRRVGDQVIAFNTICPHLGCAVEHRASQDDFYCPCHLSSFTIDGEKKNEIPPRDMDTLDVSVKDDGSVWVKYEKFRGAISEKVSV
jgi:menaquinol-cytochrome c reductase iron-sulfur subunit